MDQSVASPVALPERALVYNAQEIDAYIGRLHLTIAELRAGLEASRAKLEMAERRVRVSGATEATLGRILIRAQRAADETITRANRQATAIIDAAKADAGRLIETAEQRAAQILRTRVEGMAADHAPPSTLPTSELRLGAPARALFGDEPLTGGFLSPFRADVPPPTPLHTDSPGPNGNGSPRGVAGESEGTRPPPTIDEAKREAQRTQPAGASEKSGPSVSWWSRAVRPPALVDRRDPFFNPMLRWTNDEQVDRFFATLRDPSPASPLGTETAPEANGSSSVPQWESVTPVGHDGHEVDVAASGTTPGLDIVPAGCDQTPVPMPTTRTEAPGAELSGTHWRPTDPTGMTEGLEPPPAPRRSGRGAHSLPRRSLTGWLASRLGRTRS